MLILNIGANIQDNLPGKINGNKELTILCHGSAGMDKKSDIFRGGIIKIKWNQLYNFGNITCDGDHFSRGGTIFILSKLIKNYGNITRNKTKTIYQ